jgi:hypothetical protein
VSPLLLLIHSPRLTKVHLFLWMVQSVWLLGVRPTLLLLLLQLLQLRLLQEELLLLHMYMLPQLFLLLRLR